MAVDPKAEVTAALVALARDDGASPEELLPLVYEPLRRLAGSYFRRERGNHTLQPTALVHEAYERLADQSRVDWRGRTHFFAVAAQVMRRLLVDHARHHGRKKRGGGELRVTLDAELGPAAGIDLDEILGLDRALERLAELDERGARVVELRTFAGLTCAEVASALGVSERTVRGDWTHARAWLAEELGDDGADPSL